MALRKESPNSPPLTSRTTRGSDMAKEDEQACADGLALVNLYYDTLDRKRDKVGFLYSENNPTLIWNGNFVNGNSDITKFLWSLPPTTHVMTALDAQSIVDGDDGLVLVHVAGSVRVNGVLHAFSQLLALTPEEGKMRILSDRLRFFD